MQPALDLAQVGVRQPRHLGQLAKGQVRKLALAADKGAERSRFCVPGIRHACTSLPLRIGGRRSLQQAHMAARRPGCTGPAALLVPYFCGELAFLAGTAVSGAVTWNTSSANFRWLVSSCSAKL